jgi:nucleoid-associated protein YgaU
LLGIIFPGKCIYKEAMERENSETKIVISITTLFLLLGSLVVTGSAEPSEMEKARRRIDNALVNKSMGASTPEVQRSMLDEKQGKARSRSLGGIVYEIKPNDTLPKIAKRMYGDGREWKRIFEANRHILDMAQALETGQKITLP